MGFDRSTQPFSNFPQYGHFRLPGFASSGSGTRSSSFPDARLICVTRPMKMFFLKTASLLMPSLGILVMASPMVAESSNEALTKSVEVYSDTGLSKDSRRSMVSAPCFALVDVLDLNR
jgi:hypothetical protein